MSLSQSSDIILKFIADIDYEDNIALTSDNLKSTALLLYSLKSTVLKFGLRIATELSV